MTKKETVVQEASEEDAKFLIQVPQSLAKEIDALVKEERYSNRSEWIRAVLRAAVEQKLKHATT